MVFWMFLGMFFNGFSTVFVFFLWFFYGFEWCLGLLMGGFEWFGWVLGWVLGWFLDVFGCFFQGCS